jgi:hypothetical protein
VNLAAKCSLVGSLVLDFEGCMLDNHGIQKLNVIVLGRSEAICELLDL